MVSRAEQQRVRQFKAQRTLHGIAVTYDTGSEELSITVLPGSTRTTVEDSQTGVQLRSAVDDFLILASDLVVDDVQIYPRAGHEITRSDGAVYRVVPQLAGEPAWRWSGNEKQIMRVHTQLVLGT